MLNPFPSLLIYSMLAPLILRLVAGLIFLDLGLVAFKGEKGRWLLSLSAIKVPNPKMALKILALLEIVGGIMFLSGFYTQIAALVLGILTFAEAYIEFKEPKVLKRSLVFYSMLLAITFSLLFSGAGAFSIDLPL